ncbi:hypothetical protein RHODO2019_16780 [Rhodococcus antarcticus]|uniref:DUF222 domain-containing protein n=1 Tax=Rhodococcus antarcticus TaxID=2987751 RepID=A0ABY6P055_9NOCA|nr:hypothetical protein [Rhodococcus antarcticus]UZJ24741.1 hypothetical protein RHODO2019_16780 [Rhodococcus antarcticus]
MIVDDAVRARVVEAETLLDGLAVPGSASHAALRVLADARRDGVPGVVVVLDAIEAVRDQAELSLRAGQHAEAVSGVPADADGPHWLVATAHEWQRYLRWLVLVHDRLAADVAALPESTRWAAVRGWEQAADACAAARCTWAQLVPDAAHQGVAVQELVEGQDPLGTVLVHGRIHVDVADLVASLRTRAEAFAVAAGAAGVAGDELGRLVSEVVGAELSSRADELDLASIDQVSSRAGHAPPRGLG